MMLSCVPPYPVELEVTPNTPPVIFHDGIVPAVTEEPIIVDVGDGCGVQRFQVPVVDYDGDPQLFFKWILTPGPTTTLLARELLVSSEATQDSPEAITGVLGEEALTAAPGVRVIPNLELELSIELVSTVIDNPNELNLGTHLLELYVTDRSFEPSTFNVEPSRSPGEPRQTAARTYWFVTINTECGS